MSIWGSFLKSSTYNYLPVKYDNIKFLLSKSHFLKDSAYAASKHMQAKQYSITTMATHSKTFYHSSELEIEAKNKGIALREKKKTSCSITPEVKK